MSVDPSSAAPRPENGASRPPARRRRRLLLLPALLLTVAAGPAVAGALPGDAPQHHAGHHVSGTPTCC